ncbi:hypothetical protein AAVH_29322 [Aphelenchoides avenae]|nr:hypothetical protein AAVH_29322 [Aphelenchus avenae]
MKSVFLTVILATLLALGQACPSGPRFKRQLFTSESVVATPCGLQSIPPGSVVVPPWSNLPGIPVSQSVVASPFGLAGVPPGSRVIPAGSNSLLWFWVKK